MKIAISANGKDLEAEIDPRFGRCAYFLFVDTDSMQVEAFDNKSIAMSGGAGIQAAEFVSSNGAEAILTGNCGPNAVKALKAAGVKLFTGQSGPVRDVLDAYIKGTLEKTTVPNVPDHYGMGEGRADPLQGGGGSGRGFGQGRGMGKGQGCGMGMRKNSGTMGWGKDQVRGQSALSEKEPDLNLLKKQATELKTQIDALEVRIRRLEQG